MCEKSKEREREKKSEEKEVRRIEKECEGVDGAHIRRAVAARAAG